jgi:hypothetical protein
MTILKKILIGILICILLLCGFFFVGKTPQQEKIIWGTTFSQKHAQDLGLNWQKTYLSILDDLQVKHLRLIAYWDLIEPQNNEYYFNDLDWQIEQAEKQNAKIILVAGLKTPRWPECHEPEWIKKSSPESKDREILEYIETVVNRYKSNNSIIAWQIENEPFFTFGECPKIDKNFLEQEINLVKSLDSNRKIIITDSGSSSFWFKPAQLGDIVGISIYEKVWFHEIKNYIRYPFPPIFYQRKALIINKIFDKNVICVELQAEPWGPTLLYNSPLKEQEKTMNLEQFKKNIEFAKNTGLKQHYLWGAEWWYWLKIKQNNDKIWNEAKKLFE